MILDVPQKAGNRAIMIGIALGIVSNRSRCCSASIVHLGSED